MWLASLIVAGTLLENNRQYSGRERWKRFFQSGGPWLPF
jgi:hypothetical protein